MKARKIVTYERHRLARRRPHRHGAGQRRLDARRSQGTNVVLAAGSVPRTIPGFEVGGPIMTSDEVLMLDHVPKSVVVIGGGAIGCEFASTFADLGAKVTILEFLPKILPGLRHRRGQRRRAVVPEAGHHDPHRHQGHRPRAAPPPARRCSSRTASRSRPTPSSCRSGRRPYADQLGLAGTAVKVDRAGLRRGRRAAAAPASRASTPSATSSTRRSWPTSASPRRSWS